LLRAAEGTYKNCYSETANQKRIATRERMLLTRSISGYDNKNRRTGYFFSGKNGKNLWYRSSYELQAYKILEGRQEVFSYSVEPFGIPYLYQTLSRMYYPDILVIYVDRRQELIEVLARWERSKDQRLAKFRAAQEYCLDKKMNFSVWDETDLFGAS
jgi:hypothetical protein